MLSDFLANRETLRLMIFGGKGGAGKTTSAAAAAIHLARRTQRKILLVSTDPAHSLADSLGMEVGDEPVPVAGMGNLWARQLDSRKADERFHRRYDKFMKTLIDRGTFLDGQDAQNIVDLPLPGLDEVMAIRELANLLKEDAYDLVVMDTAPTGHTVRLLGLPEVMAQWTHAYSLMQRKHKYMQRRFTGRSTRDDVDRFLKTLSDEVRRVRELLHSSASAEFVPVTNADPLSVAETRRLVDTLAKMRIAVRTVIVNRVPADRNCRLCHARHAEAMKWLGRIEQEFGTLKLVCAELFADQVRGIEALEQFGRVIFGAGSAAGSVKVAPRQDRAEAEAGPHATGGRRERRLAMLVDRGCKFILFGGKGGVGKTSLAAAMALRIAELRPKDRVLILSIDPAHSLSDCFGCSVGGEAVRIRARGMLDAKELNAENLFDTYRDEYRRDIARAFDIAGNVDLKFDREVMDALLSLWPAGLDEIMALVEVMELGDGYDSVVLDMSPTGHLLRFLEMPELARQWLKALFRIILKHQRVIDLSRVGEKLVQLSRDIRRVQATLTDGDRTAFVAVTIPETMAIAETRRLLETLKQLGVPCGDLVINMVTPGNLSCRFCRARRGDERTCIREAAGLTGVAITEVPMLPNDITGVEGLGKLIPTGRGRIGRSLRRVGSKIRQSLGVSPKQIVLPARLVPGRAAGPLWRRTSLCCG